MLASGSVVCCTVVCRGIYGCATPPQDPTISTAEGLWGSTIHLSAEDACIYLPMLNADMHMAPTKHHTAGLSSMSRLHHLSAAACLSNALTAATAERMYFPPLPACLLAVAHAVQTLLCRHQRQKAWPQEQHQASYSCGWQEPVLSGFCQSSNSLYDTHGALCRAHAACEFMECIGLSACPACYCSASRRSDLLCMSPV